MSLLKRLLPRFLKDDVRKAVSTVAWQTAGPRIQQLEDRPLPDFGGLSSRVDGLRSRVEDLEIALEQLTGVLRHEGIPPPPPRHLQVRVVGAYVPDFLESGFSTCDDLDGVLGVVGKSLASFPRILDWGCGCGRNSRAVKTRVPACELHGMDIDPEAIDFLQRECSRLGQFHVAPHRPPTKFPDGFFDFVFGISVLTHLPEDLQFAWLGELRRITRLGGYVLMTTSGESSYRNLPPDLLARVEADGILYLDSGYGQTVNLPAFYQNTFHTHAYIRREWAKYFRVVDIQARRMSSQLDTILLERV